MIPLIGLLICFYVAMRGLDWVVVSKEAMHDSVFYGRVVIGILTVLGAGLFAIMLIGSSASVPSSAQSGQVDYTQ
jgi:hypothetical protein